MGPFMLATDCLASFVAGTLAAGVALGAVFATLVALVISSQGGYRRRFSAHIHRSAGLMIAAVAVGATLIGAVDRSVAGSLAAMLPVVFVGMTLLRMIVLFTVRRLNGRAGPTERALVLGAGLTGVQLAKHLMSHPEYSVEPIGFIDRVVETDLPLPILGDVHDLEQVVARTGASQLLIAFGVIPEIELVSVIRRCQSLDIDVWVVPRFFELGLGGQRSAHDEVWGINLHHLPRLALRSTEWRIKRVFDLIVSGTALLLLAPVLVLLTIAVRLSSPGPTFFRQERVGQRGRTFEVLKFRTMTVNDDSATTWSVSSDARVTRLGRVLRRSSLDEMPQLFNVLRGDMSLVGPRPERPHFVDIFRGTVKNYDDRHRVPVGLTGLAQVNGRRGDTSIEERAVFDNNYIENWSLWADIAIMVRTIAAIFRSPGEAPAKAPKEQPVPRLDGTAPADRVELRPRRSRRGAAYVGRHDPPPARLLDGDGREVAPSRSEVSPPRSGAR